MASNGVHEVLDSDDEGGNNSNSVNVAAETPSQTQDAQQTPCASPVPNAHEGFELPADIKELIIHVANERVRINFMLAPDRIDFSVLDNPVMLERELRSRFEKFQEKRKE